MLGILCDKKTPISLKGKFYKIVERPTKMYASECWVIYTKIEQMEKEKIK